MQNTMVNRPEDVNPYCFGHNPFRLGLGCTPGMIFSHFGVFPGRTPDMAGRWPGLSGSIGEVPEEFQLEVKISPVSRTFS